MASLGQDAVLASVSLAVDPSKQYGYFDGFAQLASGLSCGLAGLAAGMAIGIVGDAGVRCGLPPLALAHSLPPLASDVAGRPQDWRVGDVVCQAIAEC